MPGTPSGRTALTRACESLARAAHPPAQPLPPLLPLIPTPLPRSIVDLLERAHAPTASVARAAAASATLPEPVDVDGSLPPPPPPAAPLLLPAASGADPLVGPRVLSPSAPSGGGLPFAPALAGLSSPAPAASAPAGGLDGTSGAWAVIPAVYIACALLGWLLGVL